MRMGLIEIIRRIKEENLEVYHEVSDLFLSALYKCVEVEDSYIELRKENLEELLENAEKKKEIKNRYKEIVFELGNRVPFRRTLEDKEGHVIGWERKILEKGVYIAGQMSEKTVLYWYIIKSEFSFELTCLIETFIRGLREV